VTHWNVEKLRQAVRNGPNVYPGATHFEDEQGIVHLSSVSQYQRNSIAKKLLSTPGAASSGGSGQSIDSAKIEGKTVYRHLQDGDILLVNRQVRKDMIAFLQSNML
jgi:DNA-directed RNA polymerase I subunit RPA1